ncbi:MAG: hypothetical protein FJW21_05470 [Acidimicrobiia bacterium]|nr:hypothetical protein [Acidimicrobiia bacterium]
MRTSPVTTLALALLTVATAVACSQPGQPTSPTAVEVGTADLGPGGATLKAPAPVLQSPANGTQVTVTSNVPLVTGNVSGGHANIPITLEFEVRNAANAVVANPKVPRSAGTSTTYVLPTTLVTSATYTWRVRATYNNAFGPWSSAFTFKAPDIPQPYNTGVEIFDPLTAGRTIGTVSGPVEWLPGRGVRLVGQDSHITYTFNTPLQEGTFSMMVTDVDESNPGDKSKIFSIKEGDDDLTTNDYRMSAELRGRLYCCSPGATVARIITGDSTDHGRIFDTPRIIVDYSRNQWYLWRMTWRLGSFTLESRLGDENGPIMYTSTIATGSRPYRPVPMKIHIGAPIGRAGAIDATAAGMIVKNVWVSSRQTRPRFEF